MPDTPTLLVKYAEVNNAGAGEGYLTWRWVGEDGPADFAGVARIDPDVLVATQSALAQAVPDAAPDESIADGIDRALLHGPFANPESTAQLVRDVGIALVPPQLLDSLRSAPTRPLVRIQPSPSLTRVPWEMLSVGVDGDCLDDIADVVHAAPAAVIARHVERRAHVGHATVAVVDPRIPGHSTSSALGSVLGRPTAGSPLAALLTSGTLRPPVATYPELARRTDIDRDWLRRNLSDAARLLYVGHVSAAAAGGESVDAALHLCCTDDRGIHRPLRAHDLLTGGYRLPPRVALIGCNSGGDLAHPDGMGLSMAALATGSEFVTATRWAVPTNRALARGGDLAGHAPLEELVLAVDAAHRADDPIRALGHWQRERRHRWYTDGHVADSPLLWAALTSTAL